jgi:hypothetical protein
MKHGTVKIYEKQLIIDVSLLGSWVLNLKQSAQQDSYTYERNFKQTSHLQSKF